MSLYNLTPLTILNEYPLWFYDKETQKQTANNLVNMLNVIPIHNEKLLNSKLQIANKNLISLAPQ